MSKKRELHGIKEAILNKYGCSMIETQTKLAEEKINMEIERARWKGVKCRFERWESELKGIKKRWFDMSKYGIPLFENVYQKDVDEFFKFNKLLEEHNIPHNIISVDRAIQYNTDRLTHKIEGCEREIVEVKEDFRKLLKLNREISNT